jgi:hypothetical protein
VFMGPAASMGPWARLGTGMARNPAKNRTHVHNAFSAGC